MAGMNNLKIAALLIAAILIAPSCKKEKDVQSPTGNTPIELVKSVTWNVGVTHDLVFTYNADNTIKHYTSGSSNLPGKYTSTFNYESNKLKEVLFETSSATRFTYTNNRITQMSYFNDNVETGRKEYTYNSQGNMAELKVLVALNNVLSVTEKTTYHYNVQQVLTDSETEWFDEQGNKTATIMRSYESWSPDVDINPFSLLHPLYEHQAHEIFDVVVLSTLKKLPKKITETGNPEYGPVTYEYKLSNTRKRIDKLKCTIQLAGSAPYNTAEAIFHY
jgi:hypothetical protein